MEEKKVSQKQKNKIVKKLWGSKENTTERYGKGFHWVESPMVEEYVNFGISGDKNENWVSYSFRKYLKTSSGALRCLSLGCGSGSLERHLCSMGPFMEIEAYDISEGALSVAREEASKSGFKINYKRVDLNSVKLPKAKYDVVFAKMSLHHVENLENLMHQIRNTLTDGGLFIIHEFVGATQFQYPKKQVQVINEILELLPEYYRKSVTNPEMQKPFYAPANVEYMNANDPSEAIRSAEIIPMLEEYFEIVERKDYGGTLLHMLLQDIAGNFNPNDLKDVTVINLIFYIEKVLIREGVLSNDFSYIVAKVKKNRRINFLKLFR